jgi:hypothetical protein
MNKRTKSKRPMNPKLDMGTVFEKEEEKDFFKKIPRIKKEIFRDLLLFSFSFARD